MCKLVQMQVFSPSYLHCVLSVGNSKHAGEGDKHFDCTPGLLGSVLGFELVCDIGELVLPFSVIGNCIGQGSPLCLRATSWRWQMLYVIDSEGVTRTSTSTSLGEICMDRGKPSSWVLAHPWIQQVYNAGESWSSLCYSKKGARCKTRN